MHKKLAADLTSLAHRILQMKNKEDVIALKEIAQELYEKLSVLAYVDEYIDTTPQATETKEMLLDIISTVETAKLNEEVVSEVAPEMQQEEAPVEKETTEDFAEILEEDVSSSEEEVSLEEAVESVEETLEMEEEFVAEDSDEMPSLFSEVETPEIDDLEPTLKKASLEEELKDTLAVDVVADLFEKAPSKSLHDALQKDIVIGLNDRITFVKNLFDGSQEDFNRVVSQLNTFKTEKEAKKFISKMVKPDYDWSEKEDLEERFMTIILRKFA